jgi:hypothetical protein
MERISGCKGGAGVCAVGGGDLREAMGRAGAGAGGAGGEAGGGLDCCMGAEGRAGLLELWRRSRAGAGFLWARKEKKEVDRVWAGWGMGGAAGGGTGQRHGGGAWAWLGRRRFDRATCPARCHCAMLPAYLPLFRLLRNYTCYLPTPTIAPCSPVHSVVSHAGPASHRSPTLISSTPPSSFTSPS